ncbi:MAG: hypothetical protein AAFV80_15070 [Bacteroidota bacterium]
MKTCLFFFGLMILFISCGRDTSYQLTSVESTVECDCKSVKKSERWFKKRFGTKKYFKQEDSLYIPRDVIANQLYDYRQIRLLSECTDHPLAAITYVDSIGSSTVVRHFYFMEKADFEVFKANKGCKN